MTTTTTCARSQCSDAPTESVASRCLACRVVGEQIVCASHREELTCGMLLGLIRSRCCNAMVTLVRVVPL